MTQLRLLMGHEPFFWSTIQDFADGTWAVRAPTIVDHFADIHTIEEYVDQVVAEIPEPELLPSDAAAITTATPTSDHQALLIDQRETKGGACPISMRGERRARLRFGFMP